MNKQRLISLIREKALTYGEVTLSSGETSTYYIDLSKIVMSCYGLDEIVLGFVKLAEENNIFWDEFDSIGGPAMGAIPLVTAMMLETNIERSFFVRKESKEHGKKDLIEGNLQKGDRVLMIEDVVTSGGSVAQAIKAVEAAGGIVKHVMFVLERESIFPKEWGKFFDCKYSSLLHISEVLESTSAS